MSSSPDAAAARVTVAARFDLWPMPDLRMVSGRHAAEPNAGPSAEELAYDRGLVDGRRSAVEELAQGADAARAVLETAAGALYDIEAQWRAQLDVDLTALATAVAAAILEREVALDPTFIEGRVLRALKLAGPASARIVVRLHPDDAASVEPRSLAEPGSESNRVTIEPDSTMRRGDCVVETPTRLVDGRLESALLTLADALRDA
jgi:flagellar biosynthesis/type III secretory pathway protein FliH